MFINHLFSYRQGISQQFDPAGQKPNTRLRLFRSAPAKTSTKTSDKNEKVQKVPVGSGHCVGHLADLIVVFVRVGPRQEY